MLCVLLFVCLVGADDLIGYFWGTCDMAGIGCNPKWLNTCTCGITRQCNTKGYYDIQGQCVTSDDGYLIYAGSAALILCCLCSVITACCCCCRSQPVLVAQPAPNLVINPGYVPAPYIQGRVSQRQTEPGPLDGGSA